MSTIGGAVDIESILQETGETGSLPASVAADPGSFFLAVHRQWVKNGGRLDGKNRNSVRHLADLLEAEGTWVPSLTSKLKGETRLRVEDARALLGIYFSRWRFGEKKGGRKSGYMPLGVGKPEAIQSIILRSLFGEQVSIRLPEPDKSQRSRPKPDETVSFLAGWDLINENFKTSKVVVHISRIGSVEGPTTAAAIRAFCEVIDGYWRIDREDELDRILIWIVDPGDRDISNDESLAAFANAERLATFFRAVRLRNDPDAEARWAWLSTHAAVLVGSIDTAVMDRLYASELKKLEETVNWDDATPKGIKHGHFLLGAAPIRWLQSREFTQLYGDEFEDLEQSSFVLWLDTTETQWSYFGYAPANPPILGKNGKQSFTKFLELASPGPIYDRAATIVHAAACFRLGMTSTNISENETMRAILILRHLDFAVFRLSEFLDAEKLRRHPP